MKTRSRLAHNKKKTLINYIGGQSYESKSYKKDNVLSFIRSFTIILSLTVACQLVGLYSAEPELEFLSPIGGASVFGGNIEVQAIEPSPTPSPVFESEVEAYIYEVFGEDYEDARTVAHCESKLRPNVVGDTALMSINTETGELVGDSIGVFQIRTGSTNWNRAARNGLTAEEFRTKLKGYKYNINYAKTIFDRQGFEPWTCKKDL